ncbi:MAG: hypothetical protein IPG67_06230 [Acidobacteria bacterium]|nr:hypothetical protein [Acidobacteriota bacterium]
MNQVAIAGIRGSYSESAASEYFDGDIELVECSTFEGAFGALRSGLAEYAVIPVRNSIVGEIASTKSLMKKKRPKVVDHVKIRIEHVLAGVQGATFDDLSIVRSHAEALKQCSSFLTANPHLEQLMGFDTASSVRSIVVAGLVRNAAICSERAADIYGASILRRRIADRASNATTFAVISIGKK